MQTIYKELAFHLIPLAEAIGVHSSIDTWLTNMTTVGEGNLDKNRLATSLAIDLKTGLLYADEILEFLKNIDYNLETDNPNNQMESAIFQNVQLLHKILENRKLEANPQYASVMPWEKFADKCHPIPSGVSQYNSLYKMVVKNKSVPITKAQDWNNWSRDIVWVLPYDNLRPFLDSVVDSSKKTELVLNYLGVHNAFTAPYSGLSKFVYILYPTDFSLPCYQPNTLMAYWKENQGLYISYKKVDDYGRTFSTDGKIEDEHCSKERIHSGKKYVTDKFEIHELGIPSKILDKDTSKILHRAKLRYNEC